MKQIMIIDHKNYSDDMPVFERFNVRAIIYVDGKFAMEKSRYGDFKVPGGGIEPHETFEQALIREVQEETGLIIKKDSILELGEILEIKRDIFQSDHKYVCHSLYYQCDIEPTTTETNLTPSEISQGYELCWAGVDEILESNLNVPREDWIVRDTKFIQWFMGREIQLFAKE